MDNSLIHIVPAEKVKARVSDYAIGLFPGLISRNGVKKALKRGEILVNGETAVTGTWVEAGTKIEFIQAELPTQKVYEFPLPVIFEDEHLALINKPPGILVSGNQFKTVQNALAHNLRVSSLADALPRFQPVHRLDYPTSGILMVAKTSRTLVDLGKQFQTQAVKKRYRAIVAGEMDEHGFISSPIEGKSANSEYTRLQKVRSVRFGWLSLLTLSPHTGRTHQLRIHLAEMGFPILGERKYGNPDENFLGKGLFLSAVGIDFIHPMTNKRMSIKIEMPQKFRKILQRSATTWEKQNGQ